MNDAPWTDCGEAGGGSYGGRTLKTCRRAPWGTPVQTGKTRSDDVVAFSPHSATSLDRESRGGGTSRPGGGRRP